MASVALFIIISAHASSITKCFRGGKAGAEECLGQTEPAGYTKIVVDPHGG